jgi:hypothetical protein
MAKPKVRPHGQAQCRCRRIRLLRATQPALRRKQDCDIDLKSDLFAELTSWLPHGTRQNRLVFGFMSETHIHARAIDEETHIHAPFGPRRS